MDRIREIDKVDEERGLEQQQEERRNLFAKLKQINFKLGAIDKQKARAKWLEGEYEYKIFS